VQALDPDILPHCTSRMSVRVRFCETDMMGVVHHGNYLAYFEAGRIEYLRRRGLEYRELVDKNVHLPVVHAEVRYRKPTRFGDVLTVETRLVELGRASVRFAFRVLRGEGDELMAEGSTQLACVGETHAPRRLPPETLAILTLPEQSAPRD
jgi:acyl-CoA thioester hydrolase